MTIRRSASGADARGVAAIRKPPIPERISYRKNVSKLAPTIVAKTRKNTENFVRVIALLAVLFLMVAFAVQAQITMRLLPRSRIHRLRMARVPDQSFQASRA